MLEFRHAVLDGTMYDVLGLEFHQERDQGGAYNPIHTRAPSVRHGLCRTVVNDSVAMLFSEGHFPEIACKDEGCREALSAVIKDCQLPTAMIEGARWGSTGSVAFHVRALSSKVFVAPMRTTYLTPTWNPNDPDELILVTELYKVKGGDLRAMGYDIEPDTDAIDYWFKREWNATAENWFIPVRVSRENPALVPTVIDADRTVIHSLGFCPMVWVKNLPGGDDTDGTSTFDPIGISNEIEMDYQMSQGGRGLKYTSAPTTVIKTSDPKGAEHEHVVGDAILLPENGDARHLEINGQAVAAVIEYCEGVRKLTLEALGGSRIDPDKLSAAQSGRAMEMLNHNLIQLADTMRAPYGEHALLTIIGMIRKIAKKMPLVLRDGEKVGNLGTEKVSLKWPPWYPPTYADQAQQATALSTLKDKGLISTETAVASLAPVYDIEDQAEELKRINGEKQETADRDMNSQIAVAKAKPQAPKKE